MPVLPTSIHCVFRPHRAGGAATARVLILWLLAPAVLTLLLFSFLGTIQAQSPQVLISNIGKSNNFGQDLGALDVAQEFTTGNNPTGYTLTGVDLKLQTLGATTVPSVRVVRYSPNHSSGVTLTGPGSLRTGFARDYTFTTPAGFHLEPATKYWVVVEGVSNVFVRGTLVDTEDADRAPDWSIGDRFHRRGPDSTGSFQYDTTGQALMIKVQGSINSVPVMVSNIAQSGTDTGSLASYDFAQSFTTGDNDAGYTVGTIEIRLQTGSNAPSPPRLTVHRGSATGVGVVDTFVPDSLTADTTRDYIYRATSSNAVLEGSTEYWLRVDNGVTGVSVQFAGTDDEDGTPLDGASIGNTAQTRAASSEGAFSDESANRSLKIKVRAAPRNSTPKGAPAITAPNVFRVPAVLTADLSGITDTNGIDGIYDTDDDGELINLAYRWQRFDSAGTTMEADYIGTAANYRLTDDDAGKTIKVLVNFTDDDGYANGPLTSPATEVITAAAECAAPTYTGGASQVWTGNVAVEKWTVSQDTFYGFRESGGNGSLDDVTFTTASSDDHEINALTTSNDTVAFQLDSALAAADKKNLVLHVCDAAEYDFDSSVVGGTSSYLFTSAGQDWSGHAERTLYLSQDTAAPMLASATVDSTTLTLNFNEPLGTAASLGNGAFIVKKNDPAQTLTLTGSPSITGNTVVLTLDTASSVTSADSNVKVTYTKPDSGTDNKIADKFGNETATFEDRDVGNLNVDVTPPALAANSTAVLAADGLTLTITYNEALNDSSAPPTTAFTVEATPAGASEATVDLASGDPVSVSGSAVTLKLARPIAHNDGSVKASYAKPSSGPVIKDVTGNDAPGFTDQAVTNNSTVPRVSIEAVYSTATPIISDAVFRVTRSNTSDADLTVELEITQDVGYLDVQPHQPQTITIPPNQTTATKYLRSSYAGHTSGNLTATVAWHDDHAPAVGANRSATVFMKMPDAGDIYTLAPKYYSYTVEEGDSVDVLVSFITNTGVAEPRGTYYDAVELYSEPDTATDEDYVPVLPGIVYVYMSDFVSSGDAYVADKPWTVQTTEDAVYEGSEQFYIDMEHQSWSVFFATCPDEHLLPNGDCRITVTILDDDTLQVSGMALTSTPNNGYYDVGDDIEFTVTFTGPVTVDTTHGTPEFTFNLGDSTREAAYDSGSDSESLVFSYTVVSGDDDYDGISWDVNSLDLNGGTIKFKHTEADQQVPASLEHLAQAALSDHRVDTTKPSLVSAEVEDSSLYLNYSEDLNTTAPANSAFTVKVDAGAGANPTGVSIAGSAVTLTLAAPVTRDQTATVSYSKPSTNPIKDPSGKEADGFGDEDVDYVSDVRNLRAVPGDQQVELKWDDPGDDTIQHYEYRKRNVADTDWNPNWRDISGSNDDTTGHMVGGLTNGMEYTFQVRPVYRRNSVDTPGKEGQVKSIPRGALAAPVNLSATSAGDGEIALSWDDPSDATLTGYQYRYMNTSDSDWNPDWTRMSGSGATTTDRTLPGLTNNLLYTIELRAVRGNTPGPAARASTKPRGPLTAPVNFTATPGDRRVTLNWDNSGDDSITGYQYRHRFSSVAEWDPDWAAIPGSRWDTTSHPVTNLTNRVGYTLEVRAMRGTLEGPAATATATPEGPATVPLAPADLNVRSGDQNLFLSWNVPPDEDPRAPVTSYRVRYRQKGSSSWNYLSRSNDDLSANDSITGLTNRTHYELQVAAVNRVGTGAWVSGRGTPQAPRAPEPDPPGVEAFDVGTLGVYWLDSTGQYDHPDAQSGNFLELESCDGDLHFLVIWSGPAGDRRADEWAAHINTYSGAGTVRHSFRESDTSGYFEMNGTVSVHGHSYLTIQVRGRWGANWGEWSPKSSLICTERRN